MSDSFWARLTLADGQVQIQPVAVQSNGDVLTAVLARDRVPAGVTTVDFMPDFLTAAAGSDGYLVVSHGRAWSGSLLCRLRPRADTEFVTAQSILPILGFKCGERCVVAIVTGLPHEFSTVASVRDNLYRIYPRFDLEQDQPYEDIRVEYHTLNGAEADYSGMARRYRRHLLERGICQPLKDRQNAALAYAAQAVEVRIRLGWKPVPPPLLEQTLATEPPMKVAMTFAQVGELMTEFKRQGIEKAEFCLVGWNQKGHDGRWPQIFPVEEALGGEAALRQLIRQAQDLGYQIVCHTNSSDAYSIADCWSEKDIIKSRDGSLSANSVWSGGRQYNLCPAVALANARRDLPKVADLGFRGLHYIDVISIYPPRKCYDPHHPLHRGEAAQCLREIMAVARAEFGGFASEGAFDYCAGQLDYALYVSFNLLGKQPDIADAVIPLWQLVYHGIILSNPSAETVNPMVKSWQAQLKLIEHGGRPLMYYYSKFVGGNRTNWMGNADLTCETPEQLRESVRQVRQVYDEFQAMAHLQLEFMDQHDWLTDTVCRTAYSDGSAFICNYGETDFSWQDQLIPPHEYRQVRQAFV